MSSLSLTPLNDLPSQNGGFESLDLIEDADVRPVDRDLMAVLSAASFGNYSTSLGKRERLVVESRYSLAGCEPRTLGELGSQLRLSNERVWQIEVRALDRLRCSRNAQRLRGYLN